MSKIDRLSILGVRSFSPNDRSVIQFDTPLTLIVGHNGAGKTTIIECLKYATTGDFPPGASGAAFIHDPKCAHESIIKAQIKLRFTNVKGQEMMCARSMTAEQKKGGKLSQKTLDGLLTLFQPGRDQVTIGTKCTELDVEMPINLGVSKAILEHVIFCHQEDSLWPLSAPGELKKYFDEIFAATKYTKALENIKKIRKDQLVQIKLDRLETDHTRADRDKSLKIKQNLSKITEQIATNQDRITVLDGEISQMTDTIQTAMRDYQVYLDLNSTIATLKRELEMLTTQCQDIESNSAIMKESEEELQDMLDKQSLFLQDSEEFVRSKELERSTAHAELQKLQSEISNLASTRGRIQADHESYRRNISTRDSLIAQLSRDFGFNGFQALPLSDQDVSQFMGKLTAEVTKYQDLISSERDTCERSLASLTERINKITSEKGSKDEVKAIKRRSKQENIRKLQEISAKLNSISEDQQELELKREELVKKSTDLEASKQAVAALDFAGKLTALDSESNAVVAQEALLKAEMGTLSKHADSRAKMSIMSSQKEQKLELILRGTEFCKREIQKHFSERLAEGANIERELGALKRARIESKQNIEDLLRKSTSLSENLQTRLSIAKTSLSTKEGRLNDVMKKCSDRWGREDIAKLLKLADADLAQNRHSLSLLESGRDVYKDFEERAKQKKHCPLCDSNFHDDVAYSRFLAKLRNHVADSPKSIADLNESISALLKKKEELSRYLPLWNEIPLLNSELAELKQQIESAESEFKNSSLALEDSQGDMAMIDMELSQIDTLLTRAQEVSRLKKEVDFLTGDIDSLSLELSVSGSTKTIEEAQSELDKLNDKENQIRKSTDKILNEQKLRQQDISNKTKTVSDLKIEILQMENEFGEQGRLLASKAELTQENQNIDKEIAGLDEQMKRHDPELNVLKHEQEDLLLIFKEKEAKLQASLAKVKDSSMRVSNLALEISRFVATGSDKLLAEVEEKVAQSESRVAHIQETIADLGNSISGSTKRLAEFKVMERTIKDNLRHRLLKMEAAAKEAELDRISAKRSLFDADTNRRNLEKLRKDQSTLNGERSSLEGTIQQMLKQKADLNAELRDDYDKIEQKYVDIKLKLSILEEAHRDLEKYGAAMDAAIMKYHALKMEEINRSIRELWANTYRGTDIDGIEIRSDADQPKGGRSYNYRVVMLKGDSELDMRGRCSAGQKVLASLIIRLALAESFCVNCGIFALDEPTTNLDRENINSLAESLKEIIKLRRQQNNFQLIIITHDEEFIQLVGHSDYADCFYDVYKDQNQYSNIRRKEITNN